MEEKTIITAEGGFLSYQIEKGLGVPLIFLHGGGGSLSAWNLIRPYLHAIKGPKIYLDLRGHGKSFRPKNWQECSLEKHAEDIVALINGLRLKQCIIIGHCLGSMVAATFASKCPEKVEKLILINPGVNKETLFFNRFTKYVYTIMYTCIRFLNIRPIKRPQYRINYAKFQNSHDLSLRRLWVDLSYMGLRTALCQCTAFFNWDFERIYKEIKIPTYIIGSKNDILFGHLITMRIQNYIPGARLFMIDSNHISIVTHPKEVMKQMKSFF